MSGPLLRRATDRPRSRRFRRGIYLLPSLFTTLNMGFGYYALYHAIMGSAMEPWHYNNAAKAIGFAIIFDGLDGRIARMTNTESDFGREFDSLADVITFGVAPAILAWMWGYRLLGPLNGNDLLARIVQLGAIASFIFLISGASRLARFNIQHNPQPSNPGRPGKKYFVGMPIPAGAGVIAAIVHFTDGVPVRTWWMGLIWAALVFVIAYLMISTWRFYSFKDLDFRSRHPFWVVLIVGGIIACTWYFSEYFLFFIAMVYMLSGIVARLMYILRRPGSPPAPPLEASTAR